LSLDACDNHLRFQLVTEKLWSPETTPTEKTPPAQFDKFSMDSPALPLISPRIHWGLADVVLSTPAKFLDDFAGIQDAPLPSAIVFDEADYILTGSTRAEAVEIMDRLQASGGTQSIFVSATLPAMGSNSVGYILAKKYNSAECVTTSLKHSIPPGISAEWLSMQADDFESRAELLASTLLPSLTQLKTLVFCNSVSTVAKLHWFLREKNWKVARYSKGKGAKSLPRNRDAELFSSGETTILIASDLAARGIDWPNVGAVINFEMPRDASSWLHRAGRCGRIGKSGKVITLVGNTPSEKHLANLLKARVDTGKNFHGIFSSKRSLSKNQRVRDSVDESVPENEPNHPETQPIDEEFTAWVPQPIRRVRAVVTENDSLDQPGSWSKRVPTLSNSLHS